MDAERMVAALERLERRLWAVDERGLWTPPDSTGWSPGEFLGGRRRLLRWSQDEVAHCSGLSQGDVSRVEAGGNARLGTLTLMANALGCDWEMRLRPRPGSDQLGPPSPGRGRSRKRWERIRGESASGSAAASRG